MRIFTSSQFKGIILAILLGISQNSLAEYIKLEPAFTVNLSSPQEIKFAQVSVQVRVATSEAAKALETYNPPIRDALIMLLSTKTAEQVSSRQGKEELRKQAIEAIRKVLKEQHVVFTAVPAEKKDGESNDNEGAKNDGQGNQPPKSPIEDIFFTRFIIQ